MVLVFNCRVGSAGSGSNAGPGYWQKYPFKPELSSGQNPFLASCNSCHVGEGHQGSLIAPPLSTTKSDEASWLGYIKNGKGTMPSFHSFSNQVLNGLISYLKVIQRVAR